MINNATSEYISKRIEVRIVKHYLHCHIHCSIVYNNQHIETTQVYIDGWMDKDNVIYRYNGIFFNHEKGNPAVCNNRDEPWGHYAKWNKPVTEGQILHDSTYTRYLK